MLTLKNPKWINEFFYQYDNFEKIPQHVFDEINENLRTRLSAEPLVSIIIPAWNEEINILRAIASLSKTETNFPFEIIVVNNNSTDNTQLTIDKLHVTSLFEKKQGPGPARQKGQEHARGKYVLLADADCFYPPLWLNEMIKSLSQPNTVVVYGRYAFISEPGFPRWQLAIFETLKNIFAEVRHINRPYLNTYGLSMGYIKELGLKVGFIKSNYRGEDGVLTYDLMKYGSVNQVKSKNSIIWTFPRTLQRNGTLLQALTSRIKREIFRFGEFFHTRMKSHAPRE